MEKGVRFRLCDAKFGYELLQKGCISYEGVEGSENMVNEASENLKGTEGKVHLSTLETWNLEADNYDLVVSRLALHYLEDLKALFKDVHKSLTANGKFIFNIQHPVLTSSKKTLCFLL